ncbi:MAG: hypothetical protein MI922_06665, partial [Bacteroidales bacterium]|nr:hypothetical protein [Bacteroidales bacterium]
MKQLIFSLSVLFLLASCNKKDDHSPLESEKGTIEFSFSSLSDLLKSTDDLLDVQSIVVTLEDVSGKKVLENKKIKLFKFNENYTSEPVELYPGEYNITKFWVTDKVDEVLYAT